MDSNLTIHSETEGDILIVTIAGRLDAPASTQVKGELEKLLSDHARKVVIDLAGMSYVGSAGLREFFLAGKSLARVGGSMMLCALQPPVQRIFDISGLPTSYPIVATREEAIQRIKAL